MYNVGKIFSVNKLMQGLGFFFTENYNRFEIVFNHLIQTTTYAIVITVFVHDIFMC